MANVLPFQLNFKNTVPFYKLVQPIMGPYYYVPVLHQFMPFVCRFRIPNSDLDSIIRSWDPAQKKYKKRVILVFEEIKYNNYTIERNITDLIPENFKILVNRIRPKLPTLTPSLPKNGTNSRNNFYMDITVEILLKNKFFNYNYLAVQIAQDESEYLCGIFLVDRVTTDELVVELKEKPLRECQKTKDIIKKSMEGDTDLEVVTMLTPLVDPLSKLRMKLPARGVNCVHLQCFDAVKFLQMNERKQTWACPLCMKRVQLKHIEVDEFFLNILDSPDLSETCEKIILLNDGSWSDNKNGEFSNMLELNGQSYNQGEVYVVSDSEDDSDNEDGHSAKRRKCL